jgi:hypothetical protein
MNLLSRRNMIGASVAAAGLRGERRQIPRSRSEYWHRQSRHFRVHVMMANTRRESSRFAMSSKRRWSRPRRALG